jgi:Flp pilus assembly protein TadD
MVKRTLLPASFAAWILLTGCSDRGLRKDAREALARRDGERAARFYSELVDRDPADSRSRRGLAEALVLVARERDEDGEGKPADWSRAAREFDRLDDRDSATSRLRDECGLGKARSQLHAGDTDRAVRTLHGALERNPRATASRNLLAIVLDRQGEHGRAEDLFLQNTAIDSTDADSWFNLALVEWSRGRRIQAAEHILHASRLNPKDPEILLWLERIATLEDPGR